MAEVSDVAAERGLLSGIIKFGGEAYDDVCDIVSANSFTLNSNQIIWKIIEHTLRQSPEASLDFPTLLSSANSVGVGNFFDKQVEANHLRSIMNTPIEKITTRRLAAKVRKLEIGRLLIEKHDLAKSSLSNITGDEKVDEILSISENALLELTSQLSNSNNQGAIHISSNLKEYLEYLVNNPREQIGISTGYKLLDKALGGGLRGGSLDIISARLKVGKSQLTNNIGLNIAFQGIPVLNCDTEMSIEEQQIRAIANLSGVDAKEIETGKFGKDKRKLDKVNEAREKLELVPYDYLSISGLPFEDALSQIRRWVLRKVGLNEDGKANPCVIIYDYIKLMDDSKIKNNISETQALGFIATSLKNFGNRFKVPILALAQLNREGIEAEDTSAIAASDRIAWFATSVMLYKFKTAEEKAEESGKKTKYTHKLISLASRHGEKMEEGDYINYKAEYNIGKITEGPLRSQLLKGKTEGFEIYESESQSSETESSSRQSDDSP